MKIILPEGVVLDEAVASGTWRVKGACNLCDWMPFVSGVLGDEHDAWIQKGALYQHYHDKHGWGTFFEGPLGDFVLRAWDSEHPHNYRTITIGGDGLDDDERAKLRSDA